MTTTSKPVPARLSVQRSASRCCRRWWCNCRNSALQPETSRAVSSKSVDMTDARQQAVLEAMLREAQRDQMPIQPGLVLRTAGQTIASLQNALGPEDAREAA